MKNNKTAMKWSWIIIVAFFALSIINIWFGLFGFICMITPIYHALRGRGKIHCAKYCPRGSFLGKFLSYISLNQSLPKFMNTKKFKTILLILMITMLTIALIHSNLHPVKVAQALFRFMLASFIVGIIMGIFFKPRSWCQVCPMGYATGLIDKQLKKKKGLSHN